MNEYSKYTLSEFFKYCQKQFQYGWVDRDGKMHSGVNDAALYSLQSPEELMNSKLGICWDRTELYRDYFENMTNFKCETYYLLYDDFGGCPSHTILVYYDNDQVYWFEPMFQDEVCYYSGIHEYPTICDLLQDFQEVWIKNAVLKGMIPKDYCSSQIFIYQYEKPPYHINGYEMREHINSSKLIQL